MRPIVEFAGVAVLSTSSLLAARVLAETLPHLDVGSVVTSAAQVLAAATLAALWFVSTSRDAQAAAAGTALTACFLAFSPSSPSGSTLAGVVPSVSAGLLLVVATVHLGASSSERCHRRDRVRPTAARSPATVAGPPVAVAVDRAGPVAPGASVVVTRPVFVDLSGRRRVLTRWCGRTLAAACVAYMALACAGVSAVHVGPLVPVPVPGARLPEPERLRGTPGALEQASGRSGPSIRQAEGSTRPATTGTTR